MVFRELESCALLADDTSGVARIGTVQMSWSDEDDVGGTSGLECVISSCDGARLISSNLIKFFLSSGGKKHLVDLDEDVLESLLIVLGLVRVVILEFLDEVALAVFGDLATSVAIKDCEEREARLKVHLGNVSVLV